MKIVPCCLPGGSGENHEQHQITIDGVQADIQTKYLPNTNLEIYGMYCIVAKRWLCKQQPLVGNARYIHVCNNGTTVM
jgi:hypothetical protein